MSERGREKGKEGGRARGCEGGRDSGGREVQQLIVRHSCVRCRLVVVVVLGRGVANPRWGLNLPGRWFPYVLYI